MKRQFVICRDETKRPPKTYKWLPETIVEAPTSGGGISPVVGRISVVRSAIDCTPGLMTDGKTVE